MNKRSLVGFLTAAALFLVPANLPGAAKELIFAQNTDVQTLDPHLQNDTTSEQVVFLLYNALVKRQADGTIAPDLATSWKVSSDKKTWTFSLKKGVKFHSGREMTAEDVKATYARFMANDDAAKKLPVKNITKMFTAVDVKDKYTVSITTDAPYGPMLALLSNKSLSIMDPALIAKYQSAIGSNAESINGTGPYKIQSWKKDQEIVLVKNPNYFGEAAKTERIIIRVMPEASSRVIALENGEVDIIASFPSEDQARLAKGPDTKVIQAPSVGARLFRFGCNNPIIANTKVRQAIVYAIDRPAIIKAMFEGQGVESKGPLTPAVWGHVDLGVIKRDLPKAKKLLTEAGYPNGFKTKIVTTPRYAKGVELAEALSAQLKDIGITAEIQVLEWAVLQPTWGGLTPEKFDEPIFIMGAGTSMMDADGGLRGLYTTTETGKNERNYGFYSNKEVDKLVLAGMTETDPKKRLALYKRAQEILYREDPVAIWLFDRPSTVATRSNVKGFEMNGLSILHLEKFYKD